MAQQLRVVVVKDENIFVAQCLEVDIAAQGKTAEEAFGRLKVALHAEAEEARANGKDVMDIGPAPAQFQGLYSAEVVDRFDLVA